MVLVIRTMAINFSVLCDIKITLIILST